MFAAKYPEGPTGAAHCRFPSPLSEADDSINARAAKFSGVTFVVGQRDAQEVSWFRMKLSIDLLLRVPEQAGA